MTLAVCGCCPRRPEDSTGWSLVGGEPLSGRSAREAFPSEKRRAARGAARWAQDASQGAGSAGPFGGVRRGGVRRRHAARGDQTKAVVGRSDVRGRRVLALMSGDKPSNDIGGATTSRRAAPGPPPPTRDGRRAARPPPRLGASLGGERCASSAGGLRAARSQLRAHRARARGYATPPT